MTTCHQPIPRWHMTTAGLVRPCRSLARCAWQRRLDRRHGSWLHLLLARRPCPSGLHDLEQTHVHEILLPPHVPATPRHDAQSSGNTAFDAYKAETLRRLEEEQDNFEAFLKRLRDAKDKAEFDQFMDDRATNATDARRRQHRPDTA